MELHLGFIIGKKRKRQRIGDGGLRVRPYEKQGWGQEVRRRGEHYYLLSVSYYRGHLSLDLDFLKHKSKFKLKCKCPQFAGTHYHIDNQH